jgi:hypothetical protein
MVPSRGAGPTHGDAPDLGHDEQAVVQPGAVAILLEGEGVIAGAALEAGEAGGLTGSHPQEEGLIRLVQPGQHVVQDVAVDGRVVGKAARSSLSSASCWKRVALRPWPRRHQVMRCSKAHL